MDSEKIIKKLVRESVEKIYEVQGRSNPQFQNQLNSLFLDLVFKLEIMPNYQFSEQEISLIKEESKLLLSQKLSKIEKMGVEIFSQVIAFPLGNLYINIGGEKNKIKFHHKDSKYIFPYDSFIVVVHEDTFKLIFPVDLNMPERMLRDYVKNKIKESGLIKKFDNIAFNTQFNTPNIIMFGAPEVELKTAEKREEELSASIRPGAVIQHPTFGFGKIVGFSGGKDFVKVVFPANKGKFYDFYKRRRLSRGRPTAKTFDEYVGLGNDMTEKKFVTSFFKKRRNKF